MLQNVLITALTPLCKTDEVTSWENRPFATIWPEPHENTKGPEVKKTIKKKKRFRTAYTTDQIRSLEKIFSKTRYIEVEARKQLADRLNVTEKSIKIWFQNRRMKEKRDSESSCDSSVSDTFVSSASPSIPEGIAVAQQNSVANQEQAEYPTSTYPEFGNVIDFEVAQYQLPTYQHNGYVQYQNHVNMVPNTFCYDTNVYPTQYYPSDEYYSQSQHNQYANAQYSNDDCNWSYNNFESGYYC